MGYRPSCIAASPGPLWTERLPNGHRLLLRPLVVKVDGQTITVPAGFITDYSSVPWVARSFVHWSKIDVAGVVHDWLYVNGSMTRPAADKIWKKIALCGDHSVNGLQAWGGYRAIRAFGSRPWDHYRQLNKPPRTLKPPTRSPTNDAKLTKIADCLVAKRQSQDRGIEHFVNEMSMLPDAIYRFEQEKNDVDFRLVTLLLYAKGIGATICCCKAPASEAEELSAHAS